MPDQLLDTLARALESCPGFGNVYVYDRPFQRLSAYRSAERSAKRVAEACGASASGRSHLHLNRRRHRPRRRHHRRLPAGHALLRTRTFASRRRSRTSTAARSAIASSGFAGMCRIRIHTASMATETGSAVSLRAGRGGSNARRLHAPQP